MAVNGAQDAARSWQLQSAAAAAAQQQQQQQQVPVLQMMLEVLEQELQTMGQGLMPGAAGELVSLTLPCAGLSGILTPAPEVMISSADLFMCTIPPSRCSCNDLALTWH